MSAKFAGRRPAEVAASSSTLSAAEPAAGGARPALWAQNLTAGYGGAPILSGVSFALYAGEVCALLGLNGSGKSTLLRAVCGLLPCTAQALCAGETSLLGLHERARALRLTYLPQRSSTAMGLTAADMVLMGFNARLPLLGRPSPQQRALAEATLAQVGLPDFGGRLFDEISEGQRQLVVFARALVQDAPVLLLDEPESALDFLNRHMLLGEIAKTVRAQDKAALLCLHDPNLAMAYCDRLLLLKDGAIVAAVAPKTADTEALAAALGQIYGPVQVLKQNEMLFMVQLP